MAEKTYISATRRVTARPRSKRLRECGGAAYGASGGSAAYVSGGSSAPSGDVTELRAELEELRTEFEACCSEVQSRLDSAEAAAAGLEDRLGELEGRFDDLLETLDLQTLTIAPTPSDATVVINGKERRSASVFGGSEVTYTVSRDGYLTVSGTLTLTESMTLEVVLREAWLRVDPDSLSFGADGGSQTVDVDSSTSDWEVESVDGDWISTKVTHLQGSLTGTVRVTAASNTETSARSGSVTLANGDGCAAEVAVEQETDVTPVPGEERTLTIHVTRGGAATDDWSVRNAPMVTVVADGVGIIGTDEVAAGSMTWTGTTADGAEVTYTVSKDGYTTVTGSVTMDSDRTVSVTLRPS